MRVEPDPIVACCRCGALVNLPPEFTPVYCELCMKALTGPAAAANST